MVVVVILFHSLVSPIVSTIYIFILLSNAGRDYVSSFCGNSVCIIYINK
jgi:hypothetical protein